MARFQLVFRRDGQDDVSEFRYNDEAGAPHIDGVLVVDGRYYVIRGVEWLVRQDSASPEDMPRFICTLVAEPAGG